MVYIAITKIIRYNLSMIGELIMKKIIIVFIAVVLFLSGCANSSREDDKKLTLYDVDKEIYLEPLANYQDYFTEVIDYVKSIDNKFNVYPVINNILNELKKLLWVPEVSNVKPETLNINQGYTVIGTRNRKNRDLIVEAYEVNQSRCSLEHIRRFIDKAEDDPAFDITFPRRSKYTKEEAIMLFPNWAVIKFPEAFSEEERENLLRENEEKRMRNNYIKITEVGKLIDSSSGQTKKQLQKAQERIMLQSL